MADFNPIARPYARAVFQLARDASALDRWSGTLGLLAQVAGHEEVSRLLASPSLSPAQAEALVLDVAGSHLDDEGRNLVRILAANRRLMALPAVAAIYDAYRAEEQGTLDGRLITAGDASDAVRAELESALGRRLGRTVRLHTEQDPALLGGAVIRAGDLVIDGSVRGRLTRLASALNR